MPHPVPKEHKVTQCLQHNEILRSKRAECLREGGRHLQQRPPGAEQRSAERSAARAGSPGRRGPQVPAFKPGSEYIAQPPRDMGGLLTGGPGPSLSTSAPPWAQLTTPTPFLANFPPAHPQGRAQGSTVLSCWAMTRDTLHPETRPSLLFPLILQCPLGCPYTPPTNHFLTTRASSHHTPLRSCLE